jgi:CO/xanthine dehydrogenase FAD-binding subunit
VAPVPQKLPEVERLAQGQKLTGELSREIGRRYAEGIEPLSDMRGSSWYRKQVIEVLVRRAIEQAAGEFGVQSSEFGVRGVNSEPGTENSELSSGGVR